MTVIDAEVVSESTEIVPVKQGLVLPAAPVGEIKAAQDAYHELCHALLDDSDRQPIGDKSFVKKSGWRKLAVAYNVSCEMVHEDLTHEGGHIVRAKYLVRATAPNGRHMDGIGLCDARERCCDPATCKLRTHWEDSGKPTGHEHCEPGCDGRHAFSKPDHDVPATAMTRATNRACADLFGLGEVSAEEVTATDGFQPAARQSSRRPSAPRQTQAGGPSEAQMNFINKLIDQQGLSDADALQDASKVANRGIGDLAELTIPEASQLIDFWKGGN